MKTYHFGDRAAITADLDDSDEIAPALWGDGKHDDTKPFQHLVSGRPVLLKSLNVRIRPNGAQLKGGSFLISTPILVEEASMAGLSASGFTLVFACGGDGLYMERENPSFTDFKVRHATVSFKPHRFADSLVSR